MRLIDNPALPMYPQTPYEKSLNAELLYWMRSAANKINQIADGRFSARDLTSAVVPASGAYAIGDFVANSAVSELGSAGSKYVILGWVNVAGGSPGTFVQCRALTGN